MAIIQRHNIVPLIFNFLDLDLNDQRSIILCGNSNT